MATSIAAPPTAARSTTTAALAPAARLLAHYRSVRQATSDACASLSAEDQMVQSCPEASPVKWHQAHTSWFFETFVLTPFATGYQPFHPEFHWLFNSYYKSLGGDIPEKNLRSSFSRPSLDLIVAYRHHVDAGIAALLGDPAVPEDALRRIVLGLNHEQQHLELALTDIKHAFFTNPLHPAYRETSRAILGTSAFPAQWIECAGGLQQIGYPLDLADPLDFCFDNETPRHTVFLQPYAVQNRLVTCAEYLDFMNSNGYSRPELWLSEGWDTVEREGWQAPLYWQRHAPDSHGWRIFTLGGWHNLTDVRDTPVCHVSLFEADAFARWRGCRLPTEAEWEHAAVTAAGRDSANPPAATPAALLAPAGDPSFAANAADYGNLLEGSALHPTPASGDGLVQMLGPCWQWTATPYTGYPGYKPLPGALGEYNGKFMSSQVILRGASCVTPASHARSSYRNFFSPATRWQFSGIRLARAF